MDWIFLISVGFVGLVGLYVAVWIATRAFFDNKADYNRRLLEQLEEKADAEEER
ncbi:MAG: hypothetical protein Q8R92_06225 [Deltaproteobacteria bacterium]|nr:hypothetical protein [Deltaproteobacteria bacterium]